MEFAGLRFLTTSLSRQLETLFDEFEYRLAKRAAQQAAWTKAKGYRLAIGQKAETNRLSRLRSLKIA